METRDPFNALPQFDLSYDGRWVNHRPFTQADFTRVFMKKIGNEGLPLLSRLESEGVNLDILTAGMRRLAEIESAKVLGSSQNRARNLERKLEFLKAAHNCLDDGSDSFLHSETFHHLSRSWHHIESELKDARASINRRGPTPSTRIAVALIGYVREQTGRAHWKSIADLISRGYRVHRLHKRYTGGGLKQLWKNHIAERKTWRRTLRLPTFVGTSSEYKAIGVNHLPWTYTIPS